MLLYSLKKKCAKFSITTEDETFKITPMTYGSRYELLADDATIGEYKSPFDAVIAVAKHRTGFALWDDSTEQASDYIRDWACHVDDRFRTGLVADYIQQGYDKSYRGLVDYFHFKHPYLMDSIKILEIVEDLAVTGQVNATLSDWMIPSEFSGLPELLQKWREADGD